MTGLIASHLVDGIMDGIQIQRLGFLGQLGLAHGSAVFGLHSHLQVLFGGIGHDLTQQLCELGSMLGLFPGSLFPVQTDLRIAFAVRPS